MVSRIARIDARRSVINVLPLEPMKNTTLCPLLLAALSEGPAYAAQLARRVAKLTQGEVIPHSHRTAQLLRAMVRDGLIESGEEVIEANDSPRVVTMYRLRPMGAAGPGRTLASGGRCAPSRGATGSMDSPAGLVEQF
jgi:hypothetical protein